MMTSGLFALPIPNLILWFALGGAPSSPAASSPAGRGEQQTKSDEALMFEYRTSGSRMAFEALFQRYHGPIFGYFVRVTRNPDRAADLVQRTFFHLHRARADFRAGAPLRPWIWTIARNVGREDGRRRSRRPEVAHDPEIHPELSVEPDVTSPRDERVRAAILSLKPDQQEVLLLHWYEGFKFFEIAKLVGASNSAVKLRAHRAYKVLRKELGSAAPPSGLLQS